MAVQRSDREGRAFAGSQLQIQLYVNRHPAALNEKILGALPALASLHPSIRWVSPLEQERFVEYQDEAFLRAVGLAEKADMLRGFWPAGGPVWDALAVVDVPGNKPGVLLVEGKSYPDEFYGNGTMAKNPHSIARIQESFARVKGFLKARDVDWMHARLYQSANRLAHLYFLREVIGVQAWLVDVCFINDPHRPTSLDQWMVCIPRIVEELGLGKGDIPTAGFVFLPAKDRAELVLRSRASS